MSTTYANVDAFWAQRVIKENKTQMRFQEDHNIIKRNDINDLYLKMSTMGSSDDGSRNYRNLKNMSRKRSSKIETDLSRNNRSSTPMSMPAKMTGSDAKTSDVYLNILKQRRTVKLLNRNKAKHEELKRHMESSNIETPRSRKASTPRAKTSSELRRKSSSRD